MRQRYGMGVGLSTLLLLATVLCMTAFATLALQSVRADRAQGEKTWEAARAYYAADAQAERLLGEVSEALAAGEALPAGVEGQAGQTVRYTVAVDENRELKVALDTAGGGCRVLEWTLVARGESTPDTILDLY